MELAELLNTNDSKKTLQIHELLTLCSKYFFQETFASNNNSLHKLASVHCEQCFHTKENSTIKSLLITESSVAADANESF